MDSSMVLMPRELTAENGAKALLIGEFFEEIEVYNPDYCGCGEEDCPECDDVHGESPTYTRKVPVSWTTIKAIYAMAVKHFATESTLSKHTTNPS